jgi:tetratricopeptide (TPR) repeat protein
MTRYRSEIIVSLFLMATVLAVYWQVRHHEFLNYDDNDYVTKNRHVQAGWTVEGLAWALTSRLHRHWHPVTWLSHMTDCQFFGLNPGWHHLSSVFIHVANTLLLFLVFRRMTGALWRSAFVAALFGLHPLHVEPVAWVADRKDLLSAFFWMLAMWAYIRYAERPGSMRYMLVLTGFVLGLMAKSMVVTLPFVLLLMDYWPLGRLQFGRSPKGKGDPSKKRKSLNARDQSAPALRLVWEKALFFLVVGACVPVMVSAFHYGRTPSLDLSGLWVKESVIGNSLVHYVSYIGKMLWPHGLATPYPWADLPLWQVWGAGLLLSGISLFVFWQRRQRPYLLVGWLWYLITLLPAIGLVKVGPHQMADRYVYLPLIGLFIMIAWGLPDLVKKWTYGRTALAVSAAMVLLGCMTGTWLQVRHWENSISLFGHSVNVVPNNHVAHNNLGVAYADEGDFEAAIGHYFKAIGIKPDYAQAQFNLGVALANEGDLEAAIAHYSEAIRIVPNYADAHLNLGVAVAEQGRLREAIGHFSEAIRLKSDYAEAHYNLGRALALQGSFKEAMGHYTKALKIKPDYAEAHYNLGRALAVEGSFQEAIGHFSEAIRVKLDDAEAHHDLGVALAKEGRLEEAIGHFSEAIRIKPDDAETHHDLGVALAKEGRLEEAIGHFSEAIRIKPDYAEARHKLEFTLRLAGKSHQGSNRVAP